MTMKKRLIYLPLERYRERYTEYLSGPRGIFETQCRELGVEVLALRPNDLIYRVSQGQVLDPHLRCLWAFDQTERLVEMIAKKEIDPQTDVIYIEDFWHPGFEMIPYTAHVCLNRRLNIYAFCHAQSVDPNDFTYPMRWWMRSMERGWASYLSGIFVAAGELKDMLHEGAVADNVFPTGTVFSADTLREYYPGYVDDREKHLKIKDAQKNVVFSSRWDTEKNPLFFLTLAKSVLKERKDVHFTICTGASELKSNDPALVARAHAVRDMYPENVQLLTGLTKASYYFELACAKVQFNCAKQDFVSYTLLEAATFDAAPLYPAYLTFPDALHHKGAHLYEPGSIADAKATLYPLLDSPTKDYSWVYGKYQLSVQRMLSTMGFAVPVVPSLEDCIKDGAAAAAEDLGG
jgi:glycosyltransferase involved in cell wall biosynthesis